ncbi:MAG: 4,5-dioxygenase [Betaproteobacteria bacterium]|nr:4,5-dioxygenase [Betaproteobacteria bacterium]
MDNPRRPVNVHEAYHAHVYFDPATADAARRLCTEAANRFGLEVGRFHERLVGPHTMWSCQIRFGAGDFDRFIPWLDEHRDEFTIFVHGLTGDDLKDHTEYAYWLGDSVNLDLRVFGS